jgi:hypothetical protein
MTTLDLTALGLHNIKKLNPLDYTASIFIANIPQVIVTLHLNSSIFAVETIGTSIQHEETYVDISFCCDDSTISLDKHDPIRILSGNDLFYCFIAQPPTKSYPDYLVYVRDEEGSDCLILVSAYFANTILETLNVGTAINNPKLLKQSREVYKTLTFKTVTP